MNGRRQAVYQHDSALLTISSTLSVAITSDLIHGCLHARLGGGQQHFALELERLGSDGPNCLPFVHFRSSVELGISRGLIEAANASE